MDAHRRDNRAPAETMPDDACNAPTTQWGPGEPTIELSYCVVNTSQRELLLRGLDAIARERAGVLPFATEVLVLDNGSRDGSARGGARAPGGGRGDRAAPSAAARR